MPYGFRPILNPGTTANTHGLYQNCYYCSVAALSNMTVEEFFKISETMQQNTATPNEIVQLWAAGNVLDVEYRVYVDGDVFVTDVIQGMPRGCGLGLAYTREDGSGHMVVLAKDENDVVKCIDYQQNPPTITDFPPPGEDIRSVHVFYRTREQNL